MQRRRRAARNVTSVASSARRGTVATSARTSRSSADMRAIAIRAGMVAGLAVLVTAGSASAATLKVTKTSDPVPGACTANDCSLREAIRRANSTGTADKILLKAKTYEL